MKYFTIGFTAVSVINTINNVRLNSNAKDVAAEAGIEVDLPTAGEVVAWGAVDAALSAGLGYVVDRICGN